MILGLNATKSAVVIAETKGARDSFVITAIRPIADAAPDVVVTITERRYKIGEFIIERQNLVALTDFSSSRQSLQLETKCEPCTQSNRFILLSIQTHVLESPGRCDERINVLLGSPCFNSIAVNFSLPIDHLTPPDVLE